MNFSDYLVVFSALLILLTEIRDTYLQWRNYETEEMKTVRRMMIRFGAEKERMEADRDKWVKESAALFTEKENLKKKLELFRRHIPPATLVEIDDSWHGEKP